MQYFLLSEAGVIRVPRRRPIKGIFCRHKNQVTGTEAQQGSDAQQKCNQSPCHGMTSLFE